MKILSLSLDSSVSDKDSKLSKRIKEYEKLVERFTIITPDSKNKIIGLIKIFILSKKILKREKYDLITVQDPYYLALVGLFLKKQFKIGLEIQVHGWEKFYGLRKFIAKYVLPKADSIRTVSQRLKRELIEKFGIKEGKITVVPIFTPVISNQSSVISKKFKKIGEKFVFLTVGRLVPVKSIGLQIEAMAEVVKNHLEVELWIIGDGPEKSNLKSQISNLKLENNVKLLGWQDKLEEFYQQADAFLLTSNYEGWGLVVVEAANYSLPIIMTDVGCAGEVIKDKESGIIIPVGDVKKLKEAMLKIIEDNDLRNRLGEKARSAIEKLSNNEETLRLYKNSWGARKQNWEDLKPAYYLRSIKYEGGKYLSFNRKHQGVAEYLDFAVKNLNQEKISFCDAGCGNGIYLNYIQNKYKDISLDGFDFSEKIVTIAQKNTKIEGIKAGNLEDAPYGNEIFDLILCSQVIEHLLDDKKGISELYRMLKKGGYLVISTDNKYNIISEFLNLPFRILTFPYFIFKKIIKNKKYFPHRSYSIKEFKDLIGSKNFKIEKLSTFRFSLPFPLYKIKLMRNILDSLEKFLIKKNFFKNKGDIIIALCKKE